MDRRRKFTQTIFPVQYYCPRTLPKLYAYVNLPIPRQKKEHWKRVWINEENAIVGLMWIFMEILSYIPQILLQLFSSINDTACNPEKLGSIN